MKAPGGRAPGSSAPSPSDSGWGWLHCPPPRIRMRGCANVTTSCPGGSWGSGSTAASQKSLWVRGPEPCPLGPRARGPVQALEGGMEGCAGSPPVKGAVQALQVGGWCILWERLPGRVPSLGIQRSGRPPGLKGPWLPRPLPSRPVLLSVGPLTWSSGTSSSLPAPPLRRLPRAALGPPGFLARCTGAPFKQAWGVGGGIRGFPACWPAGGPH